MAGAERLVFVEAPESFQQALAAQHFMEAGDATPVAIRGIEEGGIAIGDLCAELQQLRRGLGIAATLVQLDGASGPDRPMSEQATDNAALFALEAKQGEEVGDDVVIVARIEARRDRPRLSRLPPSA